MKTLDLGFCQRHQRFRAVADLADSQSRWSSSHESIDLRKKSLDDNYYGITQMWVCLKIGYIPNEIAI